MSEIEPLRQELESARGELVALREALDTATSDRERYRALYMQLLERCRLLERGIIAGQKAERFQGGEAQLSMRVLDMLLRPDEAETDADVKDDDEALQKALAEALDGEEEDAVRAAGGRGRRRSSRRAGACRRPKSS